MAVEENTTRLQRESTKPSICPLCKTGILVGNLVSPTQSGWSHLECVKKFLPPVPVCQYWSRFGVCIYLKKCLYDHPASALGSISLTEKRERHKTSKRRRNKIMNQRKASILRCFLLNMFGEKFLRTGTGVVDIAGGKGDLSFELLNLNGIPCTVIDPRALDCNKCINYWNHGVYKRKFQDFNTIKLVEKPDFPHQIRICLEENFIDKFEDEEKYFENYFENCLEYAAQLTWDDKGLHQGKEIENKNFEKENKYQTCISNTSRVIEIIRNCSIIVGLHPDQATGILIDLALHLNVPFVTVPCCVYSKQFPKRKLKNRSRVQSEEQFLQWLLEKDERIQQTVLPFEGKNKVLYFIPR